MLHLRDIWTDGRTGSLLSAPPKKPTQRITSMDSQVTDPLKVVIHNSLFTTFKGESMYYNAQLSSTCPIVF